MTDPNIQDELPLTSTTPPKKAKKPSPNSLDISPPNSNKPPFRFIDLFAGIGGMRLGFEAAGGHCVLSCEIDDNAYKTYKANHPAPVAEHKYIPDIFNCTSKAVPSHDILAPEILSHLPENEAKCDNTPDSLQAERELLKLRITI